MKSIAQRLTTFVGYLRVRKLIQINDQCFLRRPLTRFWIYLLSISFPDVNDVAHIIILGNGFK